MPEGWERHPLRRLIRSVGHGALGLALALGPVACHGKSGPKDQPEAPSVALIPVLPPASLLAEATVTTPDVSWQRLQRGIGGGAGILPSTLGGMVCALSGVDPRLAPEVDGASPAYVVVSGNLGSPAWLVAARLIEERRVRPLFEGAAAIFDGRDAGAGLTVLTPKGRPRGTGPVAAIVTNRANGGGSGAWLVVGRSEGDLAELAPYATRTLPAKAATSETVAVDVPAAALAGAIAGGMRRSWSDAKEKMLADDRALRDQHGGRAPDFGDPRAIVGAVDDWMQRRISALADLRGAHVAVDATEDEVSVVLTASPASPSSPESAASSLLSAIHPGDLAPLLATPRDALVALLLRDDAAARTKDAAALDAMLLAMLGARLVPADAKRVHAAIDDWAQARGDWMTLALTVDRDAPLSVNSAKSVGILLDAAATDPARASRAVREGLDVVSHVPAIHEPLAMWLHLGDTAFHPADVPGGGHATVATFAAPFALAWAPRTIDVALGLAMTPLPLLVPHPPGSTLADDPAMRATLDAIGPVAGALVIQPNRAPRCSATGGVTVAWGARPNGGAPGFWGKVVASDSSLRCLGRGLF